MRETHNGPNHHYVRPLQRQLEPDKAEWLRMRCLLWPEAPAAEHIAEIALYSERAHERTAVLVCERPGGGLQGFVELSLRVEDEHWAVTPETVGYIEGWYVDADVRRTAVGRALFVAAEQWARDHGCRAMGSDAEIDNIISQEAHLRLGYTETERVVMFRKPLS